MKKILVVDDSKAVHAYVRNCFASYAVTLTHVMNGKEATDLLATNTVDFDLILLDWEMPVMDGPTAFEAMSCKGVIPVVMMTTKNAPSEIGQMLARGVSEYILKPFTQDILLQKIEAVLGEELKNAA